MKRLLIISALLAGFTTVNAQTFAGTTHNKWEDNDNSHHKMFAAPINEFVNTEMSVYNKTILFSDLPLVKKPVYAVITNGEGEFIKQARINPDQNAMDIAKLRGGLYFVTIVYKSKSKKAFTLNL